MRIIDKLRDYYDYLQDPTDTLVFDRRNSYVVTKEDILNTLDTRGGEIYFSPASVRSNILVIPCYCY